MNIAMTGATGYIGKHLSSYLTEKGGHRVIPLGRSMFREGMSGLLIQTLAHCDVVINLAGAPINKRWTPEYKQELFNSRIVVTHRIVRALNAVKTKPKLMISASTWNFFIALPIFHTRKYLYKKEATKITNGLGKCITKKSTIFFLLLRLSADNGSFSHGVISLYFKYISLKG